MQDFKREIKLFLIVAAVSAVLAISGILLLQAGLGPSSPTPVAQTPPPTPSPQPQATDTDDFTLSEVEGWQTYRSDEFGFELKYPGEFQIYGESNEGIAAQSTQTRRVFAISVIEDEASIQAYLEEVDALRATAYEGDPSVAVLKRENITVAGYPAITQEIQLLAAALAGTETFIDITPQMIVRISVRDGEYKGPEPDESLRQLHGQILATFRFVDSSIDTSNWQTYRSDMFDFEFKYPTDWEGGSITYAPSIRIDAKAFRYVQIDWIDSSTRTTSFCEDSLSNAEPTASSEAQRCERFTAEGIPVSGVIDWDVTGGWARALFDDDVNTLSITIGDSRPDSDIPKVTKAFFKTFLSTFRFTKSQENSALTSCRSGNPTIYSISPDSGLVGTEVEIRGCNFSGFEGDLDAAFVRSDGAVIPVFGGIWHSTYGYTEEDTGKVMRVTIQSYCESGSTFGRYSGIETPCETVESTPGVYKLHVTAWGKKSNEVNFTITE